MNGAEKEKRLMHRNEKSYFILCAIVSVIGYLYLIISIVGIAVLAVLFLLPLFYHAISMATIRKNGVRLTARQFPEVYERTKNLAARMGLTVMPDVYVLESGGQLNAFATRFFGRNMVVLYSDMFDLINSGGDDELDYVIAHELAHIKRNHIGKHLFILPAMWIPFVGEAYSRACEYTCDRMAAYYTGNPEAAINGLTILAIGKALYRQVDREEYLHQTQQERGFFVWLAEKLSTHPALPNRMQEIHFLFREQVISKTAYPLNG
ncbi:M48 family metallopeptidase [Brevibacillus fluminis]|uniref:M48 family metallopeptidase n=1 Tax=Brevibacillus fluminis TaxID=511487 RepID=UPI003F8A42CE